MVSLVLFTLRNGWPKAAKGDCRAAPKLPNPPKVVLADPDKTPVFPVVGPNKLLRLPVDPNKLPVLPVADEPVPNKGGLEVAPDPKGTDPKQLCWDWNWD